MVYIYVCLPFGALFRKILYSNGGGGFHQRWKSPNYTIWVYFGQIYCKKHPICSKLGDILPKMVYWWVEIRQTIGIEKVRFWMSGRQAHPGRIPGAKATVTILSATWRVSFWISRLLTFGMNSSNYHCLIFHRDCAYDVDYRNPKLCSV